MAKVKLGQCNVLCVIEGDFVLCANCVYHVENFYNIIKGFTYRSSSGDSFAPMCCVDSESFKIEAERKDFVAGKTNCISVEFVSCEEANTDGQCPEYLSMEGHELERGRLINLLKERFKQQLGLNNAKEG